MRECIKVSKDPISGGIDFKMQNGWVCEGGANWFKTAESTKFWIEELRHKDWFTREVEEELFDIIFDDN